VSNPYRVMYRWIQIELNGLRAIKDSIDGIKRVEKKIKEIKTKLVDLKVHYTNVEQKKTSMKTLWMKVRRSTVKASDIQLQINVAQDELDQWE